MALTKLNSGSLPTGSVLQTKQAVKSDTQTTTDANFVDVSGLSVSITPSSISSKILVYSNVITTI